MYYSIYYINLDQLYQKVNIPKAISGHMCLIRYQNTCFLIRHFSVAKIPITHCSLYNKKVFFIISIGTHVRTCVYMVATPLVNQQTSISRSVSAFYCMYFVIFLKTSV